MISQSCEVMRPFLKPHSKRHLNQNAVSSQEFHCSNEKKPRLESNGKLMKKHDDTSSSSSVSTTSSIASREREVVINANRDVILKNSSSSIDMSDPLFDWMKLLVQKLPYIFGKKMNADLITNGTLLVDFRYIVRMSRDINTVGSRYVDKGNELLNRLDFVESHVTDLMDTVGIVLRQAYEDLMTSACPPGDVTISSADLERHQHLTVTYISTLHNLCKDFKCFGLSHVLLQTLCKVFNWTQTVAAHMLPSKRVNGSGFSPCAEHEFYLLSTASVLQMELDYLCQTVKNRKLKLCQEFGIDLNLRKAANSDLIEDEFQMELITKLCTHELLYWRKLLLTSINMSACTAAADNLTLPHTIADKLPSSATEPLQKSSEETV